jgi:protein-disulfide isomerase
MREMLLNVATALMVVCAVGATGFTAWRSISPAATAQQSGAIVLPRPQPDWQEYASAGRVIGPPDAPIAIVEFADFQCSFCRVFKTFVDSLNRRYPGQVKLVYRHLPSPSHPFAVAAARASECAAQQGRFEAMYDALYGGQALIGIQPWWWFAATAQVPDSAAFDRCVRATDDIAALVADTAAAKRLAIDGTPTILIDGMRLDGVPPLDSLEAYVIRARSTGRTTR